MGEIDGALSAFMDLWRISLHWMFFFPYTNLCVSVCIQYVSLCMFVSSRMLSKVIKFCNTCMNFIKFLITASIMLTYSIMLKWKEVMGLFCRIWASVLTFSSWSLISSLRLLYDLKLHQSIFFILKIDQMTVRCESCHSWWITHK